MLTSSAFTVYRSLSSPTANESRFTPLPLQIDPIDWILFLWIEQDYWAAFPDVSHPECVWKRSLCVSFCCLNQRDVSPEPPPVWWHTALWNAHFLYFTSSLPSLRLHFLFFTNILRMLISREEESEKEGVIKKNEGKNLTWPQTKMSTLQWLWGAASSALEGSLCSTNPCHRRPVGSYSYWPEALQPH